MGDIEYIFNEIIGRNLDEKYEVKEVDIRHCEECKYYEHIWKEGVPSVHMCLYDKENPLLKLDEFDLHSNCPIHHHMTIETKCIKRYGIIHEKPNDDEYYWGNREGTIRIVDFKDTHFEWDGHNPDVRYESVAVFFYENDDERNMMMEIALEFYERLNLDEVYTPKRCYG